MHVFAEFDLMAADREAFERYEDSVLPLLSRYRGRLLQRLRSSDGTREFHILRFASDAQFEAYLNAPERVELSILLEASGAIVRIERCLAVSPGADASADKGGATAPNSALDEERQPALPRGGAEVLDKARLFQVNAFADMPLAGNPAAVVLLGNWPSDDVLQSIAKENNLSETAFLVRSGATFKLRWFTPLTEVDLCGHATLATAHVLFEHVGVPGDRICFETMGGELHVRREGSRLLALDLPARFGDEIPVPRELAAALGARPRLLLDTRPMLALFAHTAEVAGLEPDFAHLKAFCDRHGHVGITATAPADSHMPFDFVSRMFAPSRGVSEDPVTGSAHTVLVPFWSKILGKTDLVARQISTRGGTLWCSDAGDRVILRGRCQNYLQGLIDLRSIQRFVTL